MALFGILNTVRRAVLKFSFKEHSDSGVPGYSEPTPCALALFREFPQRSYVAMVSGIVSAVAAMETISSALPPTDRRILGASPPLARWGYGPFRSGPPNVTVMVQRWERGQIETADFGLRNVPLAAMDIVIVWVTINRMMVAIWRHHRWIVVVQVPYFEWVSIATVIQLSITATNWGNR